LDQWEVVDIRIFWFQKPVLGVSETGIINPSGPEVQKLVL
jgi:hypothetical protein